MRTELIETIINEWYKLVFSQKVDPMEARKELVGKYQKSDGLTYDETKELRSQLLHHLEEFYHFQVRQIDYIINKQRKRKDDIKNEIPHTQNDPGSHA